MLDEMPKEEKLKNPPSGFKKILILLVYAGIALLGVFVVFKTFVEVGIIKY